MGKTKWEGKKQSGEGKNKVGRNKKNSTNAQIYYYSL